MPSTIACPSEQDLQQLLLGQVSEAEAEPLEEHLQGCNRCLETANKLHGHDTLAEAVRAQAGVVELPTGELVADLMQRLEALRPVMAVSPQEVTVAAEKTPSSPAEAPGSRTQLEYDFLEPPQTPEELGRLGPYRIQKVLGAGGMGVVFQAEDPHLGRRVALKVMLPSLLSNPAARQRFLREARAVAAIEHDHIVAIHQVGEENGIPFLAMPLLRGESLEERLQRKPRLPVEQVLRIGREVAEGLAAAHARGLIHRDIKPANLWLEGGEGMNADTAAADFKRVKILDFGLARPAGDQPQITQPGAIVGSPAYMAPEQTRAGGAVDARADLFSLGCVLYRAATGELPFKGDDTMAILTALALDDPPAPHQLNPQIPPALSELIMQLLAKKPTDRPASAPEIIERLNRVSRERQRLESPSSGRLRSRVARIALAAAVLLGALAAFPFGPSIYRFVTDQGVVIIDTKVDDVQVTVKQGGKEITILDPQSQQQVTLHAGKYQVELSGAKGRAGLTLSANEFTLERGGRVIVEVKVEPVAGKTTAPGEARVFHVFHSSARTLTQDGVTFEDGTWRISGSDTGGARRVRLFEVPVKDLENSMVIMRASLKSANLTGRAYLEMWCHFADGQEFFSKGFQNPLTGTTGWSSYQIPFFLKQGQLPDLLKLNVVVEGKGTIWMKDLKLLRAPLPATAEERPEGQKAGPVAGSNQPRQENTQRANPLQAGREIRRLVGHEAEVTGVRFAPDGKLAYSCSKDGRVRARDLATGQIVWLAHIGKALALDVSPDGRTLLVGILDGGDFAGAMLLDAATGKLLRRFPMGETWCMSVAFSREGCSALVVGLGRTFVLWDTETGKEIQRFEHPGRTVTCVALSPDGNLAASASDREEGICLWDVRRAVQKHVLERPGRKGSKGGVNALAFSPDGTSLLSAGADGAVWLWDLTLARPAHSFVGHVGQINSLAFSPDGKRALSGGVGATLRLWDVATGRELAYFGTGSAVLGVAFSPDGRQALSGGADGSVRLWQLP